MTPITVGPVTAPPLPLQEKTLGVCVAYSFRTAVRDFLRPLLIDLEGHYLMTRSSELGNKNLTL